LQENTDNKDALPPVTSAPIPPKGLSKLHAQLQSTLATKTTSAHAVAGTLPAPTSVATAPTSVATAPTSVATAPTSVATAHTSVTATATVTATTTATLTVATGTSGKSHTRGLSSDIIIKPFQNLFHSLTFMGSVDKKTNEKKHSYNIGKPLFRQIVSSAISNSAPPRVVYWGLLRTFIDLGNTLGDPVKYTFRHNKFLYSRNFAYIVNQLKHSKQTGGEDFGSIQAELVAAADKS